MSDTPSSLHTRPTLILRIRDAEDAEAWQTFVDTYGPLIYRYARQRGLQDADACDITQEVLAEVSRCARRFEYQPERGRFRDWLGTVTRRQLGRFWQKQGTAGPGDAALEQLAAAPDEGEWVAEFHAHVLRTAVERVRPHFEETTWRAFELAWLENRPAAAAAAEMGVPIETVYVAKSRVLKRLEEEVMLLADDLPQFVPLS
jgi:RNA polymerase sigma-70 factor (ECF subfamily)